VSCLCHECSRAKARAQYAAHLAAGVVRLRPAARRALSQLSRLRNEPDAILAENAALRQRVAELENLVGQLKTRLWPRAW
jgi:hypothetical protein